MFYVIFLTRMLDRSKKTKKFSMVGFKGYQEEQCNLLLLFKFKDTFYKYAWVVYKLTFVEKRVFFNYTYELDNK